MIILIDNKDYMIKLCKDSPDIHGFDSSFPGWKCFARLYSDIGLMVLLSGIEAERYLDSKQIYYIHIEDEGETYREFLIRILDALEENIQFISTNTSFGKLVYSIDDDLEEGTVETNNVLEIWRYHEDGRFYLEVTLAEELKEMPSYILKSVCDTLLDKVVNDLAPSLSVEDLHEEILDMERPTACADDFDYLFSADSLHEMIVKIAILLKSVYTGTFIED